MTEYLFDRDPEAGTWETFSFNEDTNEITIRRYADVQPVLDANKGYHLYGDGKGKDMWLAASIPDTIALKWLREYGVNAWRASDWPAVKKLLNDPENRYLRPTSFKL